MITYRVIWLGRSGEGHVVDPYEDAFCRLCAEQCSGQGASVQAKDKKKSGVFEAPVYRTKKRTGLNYITSFPLRTDEPSSKWILRGVALLCSVD